jgi:hypothetical protein
MTSRSISVILAHAVELAFQDEDGPIATQVPGWRKGSKQLCGGFYTTEPPAQLHLFSAQ